jgi:hypothetical protein
MRQFYPEKYNILYIRTIDLRKCGIALSGALAWFAFSFEEWRTYASIASGATFIVFHVLAYRFLLKRPNRT